MNKKSIIIYSIIAVILLGGGGYLFYKLFDKEETNEEIAISDGVETIPSDAIFLIESEEFRTFMTLVDEDDALADFFKTVPSESSDWKSYLSLHYSMKNKVDPLFVLEIPQNVEINGFESRIRSKCKNVINKKYNSHTISQSSIPDISYIVYKNYLIASPSNIILESSLRHLDNHTSLMDNTLYQGVKGSFPGNTRVDIYNQNIGKLFSGVASRDYLKYARFVQNFADWTTFSLEEENDVTRCTGRFFSEREEGNYSNVLFTQKSHKTSVWTIVPYNANFVLSIPLTSYDNYLSAYRAYLDANKKIRDYDYINAVRSKNNASGLKTFAMVKNLAPEELCVFSIRNEEDSARVMVALKCGNSEAAGIDENEVSPYKYSGYISAVLGDVFKSSSESHCLLKDDWLIVGGEDDLKSLKETYADPLYFSIEEYMSQTPASDEIRNPASLLCMINMNNFGDSLSLALRGDYSKRFSKQFGKKNFEFAILNLHNTGDYLNSSFNLYMEDLAVLPKPKAAKKLDKKHTEIIDDTPVEIFPGPYKVKNFKDGSDNYLSQNENQDIILLNSKKRPVWSIKFDGKICGTVRQIDYLKNNKLQMIFGSGNRVYLLDRLGRKVSNFPITLEKEILLGPDIYDFSGKKNYEMVILHKDNTIGRYNLKGVKSADWNFDAPSDRIVSLPEYVKMKNNGCWVIRTSAQTLIYNNNGFPVADFSKKKRLRKDTEVKPVSAEELSVVTVDGRNMILNINDGSFRKN